VQSKENTPFAILLMCYHEYARKYVSSNQADYGQGTPLSYIQFQEALQINVAIPLHVPVKESTDYITARKG